MEIMMRNLLLLSSSKKGNGAYLESCLGPIEAFLNASKVKARKAAFIPYAGVTIEYDQYESMVQTALKPLNIELQSVHHNSDPESIIKHTDFILVGGGNTFHLLHQLYTFDLVGVIREKVMKGMPYIGWSAGSNIATPSIKTTNDMPIIQPPSFHALHMVPFQINPHYLDQHPPGFNGETREQRLQEFQVVNPYSDVVALPEGTGIQMLSDKVSLIGDETIFHFKQGVKKPLTKEVLQEIINTEEL